MGRTAEPVVFDGMIRPASPRTTGFAARWPARPQGPSKRQVAPSQTSKKRRGVLPARVHVLIPTSGQLSDITTFTSAPLSTTSSSETPRTTHPILLTPPQAARLTNDSTGPRTWDPPLTPTKPPTGNTTKPSSTASSASPAYMLEVLGLWTPTGDLPKKSVTDPTLPAAATINKLKARLRRFWPREDVIADNCRTQSGNFPPSRQPSNGFRLTTPTVPPENAPTNSQLPRGP